MSAIQVHRRREFGGLADLDVRPREADIQTESANRLNLFSYLFCYRHRSDQVVHNSNEIG